MNSRIREIKYFFFSEYLSDGLRISLGVSLPSLLFAYFQHFETGLTLSLGAVCVSITDIPGPVRHKRNGMLICCGVIFLVALLTGFARLHPWTLGLEIGALAFFFSMFNVYGNRAAALGTAALLVLIMLIDKDLAPGQVPGYAALILAGGLWYTALSLSFFRIRPYRPTQQALGECIHETAKFLRLKAAFYSQHTNLDQDYQQLLSQQIVVSAKQDAVRELLFKSPHQGKETTSTGRVLTLTFVDLVDLYERTTAIHYDYAALRERFGDTGVLAGIGNMIQRLADVLDNIGFAIQANKPYKNLVDLQVEMEGLKLKINSVGGSSNVVLKKILINLRNLNQRINNILAYFETRPGTDSRSTSSLEISRFVTHEDYSRKRFKDNLSRDSFIFKHSLRVGIASLMGYGVSSLLSFGEHSYWVLLTIIVIMKPGFSLTKERNLHRLIGTMVGGLIGVLVLLVPDNTAQLVFLLVFMVATYSFQRLNYIVSVIFMTPFILLLFKFLEVGDVNLVSERILDTVIGSAIAFGGSYLLFPSWESGQLRGFITAVVRANYHYLLRLAQVLTGQTVSTAEYKVARKDVYVSAANLSAAFQRMVAEPRTKQQNRKELQNFLVLNHMLSSFIATIAGTAPHQEGAAAGRLALRPLRRSLAVLHESLKRLDPEFSDPLPALNWPGPPGAAEEQLPPDDRLLQEQIDFIRKVSGDIAKITEGLVLPGAVTVA